MNEDFANPEGENTDRIRYLIAGYIRQTLTEKEHDELDEWVSANDENLLLFEDLTDENNIEENLRFLDRIDAEKAMARIKTKMFFKRRSKRIWMYAVAASVILVIGTLVLPTSKRNKGTNGNKIIANEKPDIPPGGNKAVLTLSDGTTISLTDAAKGLIRNENGTQINKTGNGEIAYISPKQVPGSQVSLNGLRVPVGGQFRLILSDGSKVWLNAASSLQYPSSFTGSERRVVLTGEAYFEVAKNASRPFRVILPGNTMVEVLGTEFNVMAYSDEPAGKTTLIGGSVQISNNNGTLVIKPGEQAVVSRKGELTINKSVDMDQVTAWKNGNFGFKNASIETIMRQVARWYEVKVIYKAKPNFEFTADISRNEPVSKLLRLLELTDRVHFKIENKTIYVLP